MAETATERFARWRLRDLLVRYPGLRIMPSAGGGLRLVGDVQFRVTGPDGTTLEDGYEVELQIPADFPHSTPTARETGGRIARTFHKLEGDLLCLGAPTELRIRLMMSPTLLTFVERVVIPYLFGHTYFQAHGVMPFDELAHGNEGLLQHFADLFGASSREATMEFVRAASLRRRSANKLVCPCGRRRRLGRCHNRKVNRLRGLLGRTWFRQQLAVMGIEGVKPRAASPRQN